MSVVSLWLEACTNFNQDIVDWNDSNVAAMCHMCCDATRFNQDISNWDVSNFTDMDWMFSRGAASFSQIIGF